MALGGNADKSGYISKVTLIDVITKEFELAVDPEELLDIGSDRLTFDEFCEMLQQEAENLNMSDRSNSLKSVSSLLCSSRRQSQTSIGLARKSR